MPEKLFDKQALAIPLLLKGMSAKDVADTIGVTPQTICQWRKDPYFDAELNKLRLEVVYSAQESLRGKIAGAIDSLSDIAMNCSNDETKRKACMDIINTVGIPTNDNWGIGSTDPEDMLRYNMFKDMGMPRLDDIGLWLYDDVEDDKGKPTKPDKTEQGGE